MEALYGSITALAVAMIYCTWKYYATDRERRARLLHERVAYMLWTAATEVNG